MNIPKYKRYFYRFMSFRDGKNYDLSHPFSDEEILSIAPDEVAAFFIFLLFGSGNPSPDAKPISVFRRRTSIGARRDKKVTQRRVVLFKM